MDPMIGQDDPRLLIMEDKGIVISRAHFMAFWFDKLRKNSDKIVNLSEKRLILESDVEWERETV
jgi:hypothetical protein